MSCEIVELPLSPNGAPRQGALEAIARHLRGGGFAVLPTETGPMFSCDALDEAAVRRLFALKRRPLGSPIHVAVPSLEEAGRYARIDEAARRAMERLLPGPLTVVCPKQELVPELLVAGTGTLGVRIPDAPATLLVCAAAGVPLTATSLNLSGASPRETVAATLRELDWPEGERVYVVRDDRQVYAERPSTLVLSRGDGDFELLREGPISLRQVVLASRRG